MTNEPVTFETVTFETVTLGGVPVARLSKVQTADLLIDLVKLHRRSDRPWINAHVNGQTLAEVATNEPMRRAVMAADIVSCDGQSLVFASRLVTDVPLPERVCGTDVFHDIARAAIARDATMYFLGANEDENAGAVAAVRKLYPKLKIVGRMNGYHDEGGWDRAVAEINRAAPDILWVALGVPREQDFYIKYADRLPNVGLIKVCGGLFNFLSGTAPRAPQWMQDAGLEWAYRLWHEPRRLSWRYLTTNPVALFLLLTRSKRGASMHSLRPA